MPPPTRQEVIVATDALRTEAAEWDLQSTAIGDVGTKVSGMQLGRVEAGLFQLIVSPYNDVVDQVAARCAEGTVAMTDIAATLRAVATTYDNEDRSGAHRISGIY